MGSFGNFHFVVERAAGKPPEPADRNVCATFESRVGDASTQFGSEHGTLERYGCPNKKNILFYVGSSRIDED